MPCLVIGNGITALGVVRSLGRAGITSYCVSASMGEAAHSRWFKRIPNNAPLLTPDAKLADYLRLIELSSAVLFPCSDSYALEVAALPADLTARFPSIQASEKTLETFIDKGAFATLLDRLGVPHPQSYATNSAQSFDPIPEEFFPSSFLKPRDSQRFFRTFGFKALKVYGREEAVARYEEFSGAGMSMLFQEYIPGPPTNHYFIDGYVSATGEIATVFARQRIRMYPADFGNSSYMTSVSLSTVQEPVASLRKIFGETQYRGIFSAEFKKDARTGVFKILEINARPWWFVEFASRCGANVCELLYLEATGTQLKELAPYTVSTSCVNLYYDCHAAEQLVNSGVLSWGAVMFSWMRAKKALFCLDDPLPSLAWFWSAVSRKLSRGLRPQPPVMQPHEA